MFREKVFNRYKTQLTEAVLEQISRERNGEAINREVVKKTV